MPATILINRAPVLTLWASVVAERLGYSRGEALSLGKAVAGLNAQSKGQRLGIYEPKEKVQAAKAIPARALHVPLMGREVPAVKTIEGVRAVTNDRPVTPESVERYLESKFGENLAAVREAMEELARSLKPDKLATRAFGLYEEFRPSIPEGVRGWGAKGSLEVNCILRLAAGRGSHSTASDRTRSARGKAQAETGEE
jgi:hypothetical protein